ncbi:MAG: sigma-70 family RNA polymerase sigma factor [Planctomycetota bacterium]
MSKRTNDHLSQIVTHWSNIYMVHDQAESQASFQQSIQQFLNRYGRPIRKYLLGATQDKMVAEELAQEFAYRFVRGDLRHASPHKGRFRDFLKTVLRNIVNDYRRVRVGESATEVDDQSTPIHLDPFAASETEFNESWRSEIINATWQRLKELEKSRNNHFFTVLNFRAQNPSLNSQSVADELSKTLPNPVSANWVRQNLKRARSKFWSILLDEISNTLSPNATYEEIETELAELKLLNFGKQQKPAV